MSVISINQLPPSLVYLDHVGISNIMPGIGGGLNLGIRSRRDKGAALDIIDHPIQRKIIDNKLIREYVLKHYEQWHAYARDILHFEREYSDIWLVAGFNKTTDNWKAMVFCGMSLECHAAVGAGAPGVGGASVEITQTQQCIPARFNKEGLVYDRRKGPIKEPVNPQQCIFLRRYMVKKRMKGPLRIVANGYKGDPPQPPQDTYNDAVVVGDVASEKV